jgi:SAM-dependent MidA family methyltransferase
LYKRTRYTIVEISPLLASTARAQLQQAGHTAAVAAEDATNDAQSAAAPRVRVINTSILDWRQTVPAKSFVLALEVLDNLAHDKLMSWQGGLYEVCVRKGLNQAGERVFWEVPRPLQDPLMLQCLRMLDARSTGQKLRGHGLTDIIGKGIASSLNSLLRVDTFLPTMSLRLMQVLATHFPQHRPILADFHSLPTPVTGDCAPVVQFKQHNRTVQMPTYLVEEGRCDIFFPTNFTLLQQMYAELCGMQTRVMSQSDFLQLHAPVERAATRSGWNPLLEDYSNMSVLTAG